MTDSRQQNNIMTAKSIDDGMEEDGSQCLTIRMAAP
jgi:hypothetical protein